MSTPGGMVISSHATGLRVRVIYSGKQGFKLEHWKLPPKLTLTKVGGLGNGRGFP